MNKHKHREVPLQCFSNLKNPYSLRMHFSLKEKKISYWKILTKKAAGRGALTAQGSSSVSGLIN